MKCKLFIAICAFLFTVSQIQSQPPAPAEAKPRETPPLGSAHSFKETGDKFEIDCPTPTKFFFKVHAGEIEVAVWYAGEQEGEGIKVTEKENYVHLVLAKQGREIVFTDMRKPGGSSIHYEPVHGL